jgi:hypothetical protein
MKLNHYTLILDFTRADEPKRVTRWVKQSHREALKKLRHAQQYGDVVGRDFANTHAGVYPLQSWRIDSGWQIHGKITD